MAARVVYLLMTYNQRAFVEEAVASALAQTHAPLEILISDDASEDGTFDLIAAAVSGYNGPHSVKLNRNLVRQGSVAHLAHVIETIGNDAFVVMAHGDDVALPNRTEVLVAAWRGTGASMVSSAAEWLNARAWTPTVGTSRFVKAEEIIRKGWMAEMLGATLAFETEVLSRFERLTAQKLGCGLDHVLPLRAAAMKGLFYTSDILISYRRHHANMSNFLRDVSISREILLERQLTFQLALRPVQKSDLLRLARERMMSLRHWRLVWQLNRRIQRDLSKWSRACASLKAQGLSPAWVPAHDVSAQKTIS